MEPNAKFYGVNFSPFPRRGVLASEAAHRSMAEMAERTGANWVILSPGGVQADPYSEEIRWDTDATPTDAELCEAIRFAKQLGLQVALKPTVNCANGVWRARISFFDHDVPCESKWSGWFASYTAFQIHYAALAQAEGCGLFITGCEMTMTEHREAEWRTLIAAVRQHYRGPVSYNCDKYGEDHVAWWDAVDCIASSGYYPLTDWENQLDRIEAVSRTFGKPVLFSEVGCMNVTGSSAVPNNWELQGPRNDLEQADWYEAMFRACAARPWVLGFGVWDWPADLRAPSSYAVSGRPAAKVIQNAYHGGILE